MYNYGDICSFYDCFCRQLKCAIFVFPLCTDIAYYYYTGLWTCIDTDLLRILNFCRLLWLSTLIKYQKTVIIGKCLTIIFDYFHHRCACTKYYYRGPTNKCLVVNTSTFYRRSCKTIRRQRVRISRIDGALYIGPHATWNILGTTGISCFLSAASI